MSEEVILSDYGNQLLRRKPKCVYKFLELSLIFYFMCVGATTVYFLYSMDNKLSEFNNKIISASDIGKCLFKDICYDFKLGREMCGNCYSNMSYILH